jgi:acyl carrier protein
MNTDDLHHRLARLVATAAGDAELTPDVVLTAPSLVLLGVNSLSTLRIIDAVEREFGVVLDLDGDAAFLDSVPGIAAHVIALGVAVEAPA